MPRRLKRLSDGRWPSRMHLRLTGRGDGVGCEGPRMKRASAMLVVAGVTVGAASAIWLWALRPLSGASYLHSTTETEADIIRRYWPQRLIEPEWVNAKPTLTSWAITETVVRLS